MGAPGTDLPSLVFPTSSTLCARESEPIPLPTQGLPLADPIPPDHCKPLLAGAW